MGKRKYEEIKRIEKDCCRNGTYVKRTKGLLKKGIELSILCQQTIVMYIYDKKKDRVIHFSSDENFDILDIFNNDLDREFVSNKDYVRVGGSNSVTDEGDDDSSS